MLMNEIEIEIEFDPDPDETDVDGPEADEALANLASNKAEAARQMAFRRRIEDAMDARKMRRELEDLD